MKSKKPVSASSFQKKARKHVQKSASNAKKRAQHYSKGDKLVKQVSKTLRNIATTHPNPKSRKQAKLALKQLNQAHSEFGSASMCADPVFDND